MCTNLGYFLFQHCKIGIGNSYFIHSTCMLLTGMENIKPLANNHHCEIGIAKSYFIHNTCMLLTGMGRVLATSGNTWRVLRRQLSMLLATGCHFGPWEGSALMQRDITSSCCSGVPGAEHVFLLVLYRKTSSCCTNVPGAKQILLIVL